MNRRLVIRCGLACAGLCLAAWKLPGLLEGTLSSIDQHRGTLSLLTGSGLHVTGTPGAPAPDEVSLLGAASSLSPAERAKLLDAAKKHDPLAAAQAKIAARTPGKGAGNAPTKPAPEPTFNSLGLDPALLSALRALGMDPATMDLGTVDVDALLTKVREGEPKR